jgi:hypothetical protein
MLQTPQNFIHPELGDIRGFEAEIAGITAWSPVVTQVRERCLSHNVTGTGTIDDIPREMRRFCASQIEVETVASICAEAAQAGRLIDFGDWTNDVIMYAGFRGGPLYGRGMIGHPFRDPYLFMHTWEGVVAIYLVNPLEANKAGGDFEAVELNPLVIAGQRVLMISDRVLVSPQRTADIDNYSKYYCEAIPSVWRMLAAEHSEDKAGRSPQNAAASNVLDPVMTALLILSTRGIVRERVETPPKLARARMKNGKPPIPPYERVSSAPYVTAISLRKVRGRKLEGQGGHHASPVMHLRMGHTRTYASGVQTFVRDALVNATDEARAAWSGNRSHYTVKA